MNADRAPYGTPSALRAALEHTHPNYFSGTVGLSERVEELLRQAAAG